MVNTDKIRSKRAYEIRLVCLFVTFLCFKWCLSRLFTVKQWFCVVVSLLIMLFTSEYNRPKYEIRWVFQRRLVDNKCICISIWKQQQEERDLKQVVLNAEPKDVQLHLCGSNGWRERVMGGVRVWLDLLAPPITPQLHLERDLDFTLHPWLCGEQLLKYSRDV